MKQSDSGKVPPSTLPPCPSSPNCVSSHSTDSDHAIAPLTYVGPFEEAKARLIRILKSLPRTKIVQDEGQYLHAECRSLIFRFTDDLEFLFDDTQHLIHVRSASRIGYSDLGVNRQRVESIRQPFNRGN